MNICYNGHDEVCYENYGCPVCMLMEEYGISPDEVKALISQLDDSENEISDLQNIIIEMSTQIEELEEREIDN